MGIAAVTSTQRTRPGVALVVGAVLTASLALTLALEVPTAADDADGDGSDGGQGEPVDPIEAGGEFSLSWDEPLPAQRLDAFMFVSEAVLPCAIGEGFWAYTARWSDPDEGRVPFDNDDEEQVALLERDGFASSIIDLNRVSGAPIDCDARSEWTVPAPPVQGFDRAGDGYVIRTNRDGPGSPLRPPRLAPAEGTGLGQVSDVRWQAYLVDEDDNGNGNDGNDNGNGGNGEEDPLRDYERRLRVDFRTESASTGLVATLSAASGFRFPDDLDRWAARVEGELVEVEDVDLALGHVVTVAFADGVGIGPGDDIELEIGMPGSGFGPPLVYANSSFSVRTHVDPVEAFPRRGLTVTDDFEPAESASVGGVRLSVDDRTEGAETRWTVSLTPATELRSLTDAIIVSAPGGTRFPDDGRAYAIGGVPLRVEEVDNSPSGSSEVELQVIGGVPALNPIELEIEGVRNPSAGDYAPEAFSVRTDRDRRAAHPDVSQLFGASGQEPVEQVSLRADNEVAGAVSDWTLTFRVGDFGLGANDAITLAGPVGTVLPADNARYRVNGEEVAAAADVDRVALHRVQLVVPERIEPNQVVQVEVDDVVNPAAEPLPSIPVGIDSPQVEIPVVCDPRWDPPSPWPGTPADAPLPFFDSSIDNWPLGYGGNRLVCDITLEERQPGEEDWQEVGSTSLRTDVRSSEPVEDVIDFELRDGQFVSDLRVRYDFWLAHEGTHPQVWTSADPTPTTPADSMVGAEQVPDEAVDDLWLYVDGGFDVGERDWYVTFTTTPGGGLGAEEGTITIVAPDGLELGDDPDEIEVNGSPAHAVTRSDGGSEIAITVPGDIGGEERVQVRLGAAPSPEAGQEGSLMFDEPAGCAGQQRRQVNEGRQNPEDVDENPYASCLGSPLVAHSGGETTPVTLMLQPTALLQGSVMPYKILYQPPGDLSEAAFELREGFRSTTEFSLGETQANHRARNVYSSLEQGGEIGASPGVVSSISTTDFWDRTTEQVRAETTEITNSLSYEHVFSRSWQTVPQAGLAEPRSEAWQHNRFVLLVHPQFALWNRGGQSAYQMMGTQASEWTVSARQLRRCADGVPLPVPGDYYDDREQQIVLGPDHCASLLELDPMAAEQRQSVDLDDRLGGLATRLQGIAQGAPGDGTGGTTTISISEEEAETQRTDASSAVTTLVTEVVGSEFAAGADVGLEFDVFGIGGTASYGFERTIGESETEGFSTSVTYRQSETSARTVSESARALLGDTINPLSTSVWLDDRWGTFAFQSPAPVVSEVTPEEGEAGDEVAITGTHFWSGPLAVDFCPVDGDDGDCEEAASLDAVTDQLVRVQAPDLGGGVEADVVVHGPGGASERHDEARFAYGDDPPRPGPGPGPAPDPEQEPLELESEVEPPLAPGVTRTTIGDTVIEFVALEAPGTVSLSIGDPATLAPGGGEAVGDRYDVAGTGLAFDTVRVCVPFDADDGADVRVLTAPEGGGDLRDVTTRIREGEPPRVCGESDTLGSFVPVVLPSDRFAGETRYETAAQVALEGFPNGADVVFVATGEEFADALTGAAAAARLGGPVLLTAGTALPEESVEALEELDPSRVILLGGTKAVAASVEDDLAGATGAAVERIQGPDRYATGAAVAQEAFPDGAGIVYLATGEDFADALAGASAAAELGGPVLLTRPGALPDPVADELGRLDPDRVVVLGGTAAIADAVVAELEAGTDASVRRRAGANRFETAAAVSAGAFAASDVAFVATGRDHPDALAGAVLAGRVGAPLLLVEPDEVPTATAEELQRLGVVHVGIVGGPAAVDDAVRLALAALVEVD